MYPLPDIFADDYEVCLAGNFMPCNQCGGTGSTSKTVIVPDDKWEQVNFNVYIRKIGKVKQATYTNPCKICKGKGYLAVP